MTMDRNLKQTFNTHGLCKLLWEWRKRWQHIPRPP